ncbi:Bug family tripartite tricarboxylate transporter substrate binding protein [Microvirga massiliensis]|uniref:Bug family tripartite tricarboxylate transporter substrate binding protein n=1 Tax=Microvirga massiliensis TaxID=1033741 RepID=UPI00062BA4A0|nr:tripartite tricarboxylate transporter substrate binding protein [Microvirga massiliensis]
MKLSRRQSITLGLASILCLGGVGVAVTGSAQADAYPSRTIKIVVPFAAGGGSDVIARIVAQELTDKLGQSIIVENRPGAGGTFGAGQVAHSEPDGYTLLLGSSSELAQYPAISASVSYNPETDFAPVALLATVPLVLTANPELPIKSLSDLLDYAKREPGKLNYGSAGPGSATHLGMAMLNAMTSTQMTHVPYRGSAPVVTDLLAGHLQVAMPPLSTVLPYAEGEKLRLVAVSTARRSPSLPSVPTLKESGLADYEIGLWTGLLAPAGTPPAVIERLNGALTEAMAAPDVREAMVKQGAEITLSPPDVFAAAIKRELALWRNVAGQAGIRID